MVSRAPPSKKVSCCAPGFPQIPHCGRVLHRRSSLWRLPARHRLITDRQKWLGFLQMAHWLSYRVPGRGAATGAGFSGFHSADAGFEETVPTFASKTLDVVV